jgi:hypothetical protein
MNNPRRRSSRSSPPNPASNPVEEARRLDDVEHRQRGDAAELGSAVRRDVDERVLDEEGVDLGGHQRRRDRVDTAAQPLAGHEDVGFDAFLLEVPHRAGSAETGLHLVEDEQRAALAADPLHAGQVAR